MKKNSTIRFNATIGINEGYGHENPSNSVDVVAKLWQQKAAENFKKDGVYVGAVIVPSKTVYHTDWGCPVGGEVTASISGDCNPEFTEPEKFKESVIKILKEVSISLKQSTTQVSFTEAEIVYIKN